jgi:hypothetical protein
MKCLGFGGWPFAAEAGASGTQPTSRPSGVVWRKSGPACGQGVVWLPVLQTRNTAAAWAARPEAI